MTNIRVALRVRPLSEKEIEGNYPVVVTVENNSAFITDIRVPERPSADSRQRFRQFDFDHTFWFSSSRNPSRSSATQHEVYQTMGPHLEKAILAGYNACLLAYGQSGSGKTHTMIGTRDDPGIIPRLCHNLWEKLKVVHPPLATGQPSFRMEVSFLEIYREKVKDLLNPQTTLKLREHPQLGPHVQGLTRLEVTGEISLLDLLWEGERRRALGNTNSNRRSSRSHAIWTLYLTTQNNSDKIGKTGQEGIPSNTSSNRSSLEKTSCSNNRSSPGGVPTASQNGNITATSPSSSSSSPPTSSVVNGRIITNQVHLVDLAGSEKADCTTAKKLIAEGADINRSLVALGNVISALAEKAQYVPYRDSTLTWLLKDSIGGNASTSIIITASPSSHCHAQTLNSLRFAQRARLVENTPKINLAPASSLGGGSPYGFLSVMSAMELKKDIGRLAKIIKTAQNIAFQATSWAFGSMLLDNPALEQWRINNGGILRGLAPRANWTRLIHAIEGIGQAENEQLKLQRERACSEDATSTSANSTSEPLASSNSPSTLSLSASLGPGDGNTSTGDVSSSAAASKAKSLNDVMVQADRDLELSKRRHPLLNHLRRRHSRQQSESALNTASQSHSNHLPTSSSTPTHSPTKIVGTEVFIPTSSSFKCLTWQQEETHPVPKPVVSSSHSSLLSIEDGPEDDSSSGTLQSPSNHQIHQLKYLLEIHYPVTHNLDHASRISERIHGSINDEHYQQKTKVFPTSVKMDPNLVKEPTILQKLVPTMVNSQEHDPSKILTESVSHVETRDLLNKAIIDSNSVLVCHMAREGKDYLFPTKCKHFASPYPPPIIHPFESSDENEFEEPEEINLNSLPVYRAVHPEVCESLQQKLSGEDDDLCYLSAAESTLSQIPAMMISTSEDDDDEGGASSSSYEDIRLPEVVRPVNLIREFSKVSDPDCEELQDDLTLFAGDDNVFSEEVAQMSLVAGEPMDTADTIEILVEENPQIFLSDNLLINRESVINGVSDCKFRNYFAKELHQMERMGKQIKSLLQLTQRYNVVKPYLDEITNLQNSDHNKEDPEMDKCIERCSGWNVEVELKKVEREISQLNKVLKTGIGEGGGTGNRMGAAVHHSTSSTSTVNAGGNESESEGEGYYNTSVGYAQRRNIPLLSAGGKGHNQRPPLPMSAKGSVSQPALSSSSSNNASYGGGDASDHHLNRFSPNFFSTPMEKKKSGHSLKKQQSQWQGFQSETISEDEVFEKPFPPGTISSFKPHPGPPTLLSQTPSLQSAQTFYRNPSTSGGARRGTGASGQKGLQYCPSTENMSSVSSCNSTSASNYEAYHQYLQPHISRKMESSSSGGGGGVGYHLNISQSEPPKRFQSGSSTTSGRSFSKGISESSTSFQPAYHHPYYNQQQNSFNLEEIRGHRVQGGDAMNPAHAYHHSRSVSDSLDLCSCGDTNSKYSSSATIGGGGGGGVGIAMPIPIPLGKSSSRSQFSNYGGSTTTTTTDMGSEYSNSAYPSNSAFYRHQHSKSFTPGGGGAYLHQNDSSSSSPPPSYHHHQFYHHPSQPHLHHNHGIQSRLYNLSHHINERY